MDSKFGVAVRYILAGSFGVFLCVSTVWAQVSVGTNADGGISIVGGAGTPAAAVGAAVAPAPVAFDPPRNFGGGDGMRAVEIVDLNLDGFLDMVAASKSSGMASVLLNNGDATFSGPADYPAGIFPFDVTSGDFNRDRVPDLAVANGASNDVSVLLNNRDGTFQAAINIPVGAEPHGVAAGDLNGDGIADLAVANLGSNTVTTLFNDGKGNFNVAEHISVGPEPISVIAADLNGDGSLDLAVVNNGRQFVFITPPFIRHFGTVSVLLNNGDGTFEPETRYEVMQNPFQVVAADLNNDGFLDLATANHVTTSQPPHQWISVLANNGDGTFATEQKVPTQSHQGTVAAADLNQDGSPDLISSNTSLFAKFEVMVNNNDGTFAPSQAFPLGAMNGAIFVTSGDMDQDGDIDVVAASASSDMFGLYLNQAVPNPTIVPGTPDVTAEIVKLRSKSKNGSTQLEFEFQIQNIGDGPAAGFWGAVAYLSADSVLDASDTVLGNFIANRAAGLLAGQVDKHKSRKTLAGDLAGQFILIDVDPQNVVAESDETNNLILQPIN